MMARHLVAQLSDQVLGLALLAPLVEADPAGRDVPGQVVLRELVLAEADALLNSPLVVRRKDTDRCGLANHVHGDGVAGILGQRGNERRLAVEHFGG